MSRLSDKRIESSDLHKYLHGQDDFDLELFVWRAAKECGLQVSHGGSYEDPVTRKTRQYDVRAAVERDSQRIDLAIECKALKPSYPLLVSRLPRADDESFHEVIWSHAPRGTGYGPVMPGVDDVDVIRVTHDGSLYPPGRPVGKSTAQVGRTEQGDIRSGDKDVYDKWSQALASASDLIARATWAHRDRVVTSFATVVVPILVVSDAALWIADYTYEGKLDGDPAPADEATVFVGHADRTGMGPTYTMSHLHVYTRARIAAVLADISERSGVWADAIPRISHGA